jgi:hypothetical protein
VDLYVEVVIVTQYSMVSQAAYKFQQVFVYTPDNQTFIDVLRDAPLLAGFKETISAGVSPLRVQLPRSFDFYDQAGIINGRGTIAQGNVIRYYLFGPNLPTMGLLRFQGYIDTIEPEIKDSGEECVTITIVPFSSVIADHGISQDVEFGTSSTASTYVDPLIMFYYFFNTIDPITGRNFMYPLTWDISNPTASGTKCHYKFTNQNLQSIFDTFLLMLPSNWYYRINPDNTFTIRLPNTLPDHTLYVGKNINNPQYRLDWSQLYNVICYKGGTADGVTTSSVVATTDGRGNLISGSSSGGINGSITSGSFNGSGSGSSNVNVSGGVSVNVSVSGSGSVGAGGGSFSVFSSGSGSGSFSGSGSGSANVNVSGSIGGSVGGSYSGGANGIPNSAVYGTATVTTVPMQVTRSGSSVTTFGERIQYFNESRAIDLNTLNILCLGMLTQLNRYTIRTKVRIPDVSGISGMGYPIDSMKVGQTVMIVDPTAPNSQTPTLWDVGKWDVDFWDFKLGVNLKTSLFDHVLPIVGLDYGFDYIDVELDSLMPNLSKSLHRVQQDLLDFTMGISATGNATASAP